MKLDATKKANEVFQPIIDRKIKAEKIRNTLGVLERFRFFFNLPASLHENINRVIVALTSYHSYCSASL